MLSVHERQQNQRVTCVLCRENVTLPEIISHKQALACRLRNTWTQRRTLVRSVTSHGLEG
jgi:hypothetical protein